MTQVGTALKLRDLVVVAACGRQILQVSRIDIAAGEILGICGPSGSGKSTFLNAIAGLIPNATGTARWGETDILALPPDHRARFRATQIGMVFQDFMLIEELSSGGNAGLIALFSPRAERRDITGRATAFLERFGLPADGRNVATYSGGERQRVAVARALSTNPPIILADEPTASLDRAAADALSDVMVAEAQERNRTVVLASHDDRLLARADRVIELVDGQVRT